MPKEKGNLGERGLEKGGRGIWEWGRNWKTKSVKSNGWGLTQGRTDARKLNGIFWGARGKGQRILGSTDELKERIGAERKGGVGLGKGALRGGEKGA